MGDDLHHAIQAAAEALWMARAKDGEGEADWKVEMDHYAARIAVEAAAPHLTGDLCRHLEQTRRDLREAREQIEFLSPLLAVAIWDRGEDGRRTCRICYCLFPDHWAGCDITEAQHNLRPDALDLAREQTDG